MEETTQQPIETTQKPKRSKTRSPVVPIVQEWSEEKYEFLRGYLPRRPEIGVWSEEKFLEFFDFTLFFIEPVGKEEKFKISYEKLAHIYSIAHDRPSLQEFLVRLNQKDPKGFFLKIQAFARAVVGFLKYNPSFITEAIEAKIKDHVRLNWGLTSYRTQTIKTGQQITAPHNIDTTSVNRRMVGTKDAETIFMQSLLKVSDLFYHIAKSIKPQDLEELSIQEKIASLSKLSFIINAVKGYKPNVSAFTQINIVNSSREDLEKAILKYGQDNEAS